MERVQQPLAVAGPEAGRRVRDMPAPRGIEQHIRVERFEQLLDRRGGEIAALPVADGSGRSRVASSRGRESVPVDCRWTMAALPQGGERGVQIERIEMQARHQLLARQAVLRAERERARDVARLGRQPVQHSSSVQRSVIA